MIDLSALPQPSELALADFPGINTDLIRAKFAEGNIDYLISLFDFIQRSKHRAESLAQIYFNQMEILHKRLAEARDQTPRRVGAPRPRPSNTPEASKSKPTDSSMLLDL